MSFGLNIYHSDGNLTFSTTDVTWNQVDFFRVNANSSASNTYSVVNNRTKLAVQMFINPPANDQKSIAHTLSWSGNTLSVSGGNQDTYILVLYR